MMITGSAQREAWQAGRLPEIEEVRPGLWSIPVPIPASPLRYTLSYLIGSGDRAGLVLVDPGWPSEETWLALITGLARAGARIEDVTGVVVTHVHPDHYGLADRVRRVNGAWVAMHPAERDSMPARLQARRRQYDSDTDWLLAYGTPPDVAAELTIDPDSMRQFVELAEPDRLLEDGELVPLAGRRLRAVHTPGHTPGHLCLYEETEDVLLTGDHVLPRITPNIGLIEERPDPPLAAYLRSLSRIAEFDSAEALPAHEYRFRGLADRARALQDHHAARCQEILDVLDRLGPSGVWSISEQLTWSRGWAGVAGMMRRAALAETAAHLDHLVRLGQVGQRVGHPSGTLIFSLTPAPSAAAPPGRP
jgi:glyoxylase-like metal-dependent hydrolase (beta-lactamase superfamily II)